MCDPFLAGIYARKLELTGFDVEVTEDFVDGLKLAMKIKPAVIIFEIDCVADPLEAIREIRSSPILNDSRLLIVGDRTDKQLLRDLKRETDGYLLFGHFVPEEIVNKINNLYQTYGKAIK